jgi:hypothetical protein
MTTAVIIDCPVIWSAPRYSFYFLQSKLSREECTILVGKPEGKRPQGRPRRRWVDNIKMDLREIGLDGMDWIDLAQDRDQWRTYVNLRVS